MPIGCGCGCGKIVELKGGKRTETYEITESGHYYLKGDISFCPPSGGVKTCAEPGYQYACKDGTAPCPNGVAIGVGDDVAVLAVRISASDVTLDLGGYELSQGNDYAFVRGIQIERGVSNVRLLNGVVRGFSQWGIRVRGDSKDVTMRDLTVTKCGFNNDDPWGRFFWAMGAIALGESRYFNMGGADEEELRVLSNVYMDGVRVVDNYYMGMFVGRLVGLEAEGCNFDDTYRKLEPGFAMTNGNSDRIARYCYPLIIGGGGFDTAPGPTGGETGLVYDVTRDFVTEHVSFRTCTFNGAKNETPGVGTIAGFAAARCEVANAHDVLFKCCEWRNYYAVGGQATAVDHDGVYGLSYIDCLFSDMISEWSFAEGLHLSGSIDRINVAPINFNPFTLGASCEAVATCAHLKVHGCTFRRIIGTNKLSAGIWSWGNPIDIEDCTFDEIRSGTDQAHGIHLESAGAPPKTNVLNVRVKNVRITNISGVANAYGLLLHPEGVNFNGNELLCKNALIEDVFVSDVKSPGAVFGIFIQGANITDTQPNYEVFVENVIVRNCQIMDVKSTSQSPGSDWAGVSMIRTKRPVIEAVTVLDSLNGIYWNLTENAVVKDCEVENCVGVGYSDAEANASTALLLNNRAYKNGTNYSVTYSSGNLALLTRASPSAVGVVSGDYRAGVDNLSVN